MNCLTWNCRGLGNAATVREVCALAKEAGSQIVFLSETRQKVEKIKRLRNRLGLRGFAGVDCVGRSGGLALYWHESIFVEVKESNDRYIDVYVRLAPDAQLWHITFVYGEPRVENRHRMWSALTAIKQSSNLPWLVLGDFNEALWQFEHLSVHPRQEQQMQLFRDALQVCELHDLGFKGLPYTYDNKRGGRSNVRVRLDRVVADNEWRDLFPNAQVTHLVSPCSDHCPISLNLCETEVRDTRKKCLMYEICWERDPALPELIQDAWIDAGDKSDLGDINRALSRVMSSLQSWSKSKFKNVGRQLEKVRKKLAELLTIGADRAEVRRVTDHMNELLYREEMLWLQRSRISWLKEGDRNTRFFHSKAIWRAKKNRIHSLRDSAGTVHHTTRKMEQLATDYFRDVYTADPNVDHTRVSSLFQRKVSDEMNETLCKDFTDDEISNAVFQIGPLKAPGPDGFPARFYQRNWGSLKTDIIHGVKKFFCTGIMPEGVNDHLSHICR